MEDTLPFVYTGEDRREFGIFLIVGHDLVRPGQGIKRTFVDKYTIIRVRLIEEAFVLFMLP